MTRSGEIGAPGPVSGPMATGFWAMAQRRRADARRAHKSARVCQACGVMLLALGIALAVMGGETWWLMLILSAFQFVIGAVNEGSSRSYIQIAKTYEHLAHTWDRREAR